MKHSLAITLILVAVFFLSQIVGLSILSQSIEQKQVSETGEINVTYTNLPLGMERPNFDKTQPIQIVVFIVVAILVGTTLVLILRKFRAFKTWKFWFFMSVSICLMVAFYSLIKKLVPFEYSGIAAVSLGAIVAFLKVYKQNVIVQNLSEVFVYGGLAVIFVPILNIYAVTLLLLTISVYDMIAVWQSKHMVKLAKFQTESKVFAGLMIPYAMPKKEIEEQKIVHTGKKVETEEVKSAILGGGDIGFPLLFAGVLMEHFGFLKVLIVPVVVSIGLFLLLYFAKKDRFYPAMPFITVACFVGYGILWLI